MKKNNLIVFMVAAMFALLSAGALVIVGCGGSSGGGSDDDGAGAVLADVGGTTYNSAAGVGDLLLVQVNLQSNPPQYSYLGLEGDMAGQSGRGTLTLYPGYGSYVYSVDGSTDLLISVPDYITLVAPEDGGLIAGVPQVATGFTVSDVEGTYNFISMTYNGSTTETDIGIFEINGGTWEVWAGSTAIDSYTVGNPPDDSGTWEHAGDGIIHAFRGSTKMANAMILAGSTGGKVLVIDHCEASFRGISLGIKKQSTASGDVDGTYDVLDPNYTQLYDAVVSGPNVTINYPSPTGTQNKTLSYDQPWEGFIEVGSGSGDYVLVNTDGVYFGGSPDSIFAAIEE